MVVGETKEETQEYIFHIHWPIEPAWKFLEWFWLLLP